MRTHAPPSIRTLMATAAELRAAGNSWETIALRLKRTVRTVRAWATRYPDDWNRRYRAAEDRQLADAGLEACLYLRKLQRSTDERIAERVAKFLYDKRCKAVIEQDKLDTAADNPAGERDDDWEEFIAYVEGLTDEERQACEEDMVAARLAEAPGGVPANGGSEGAAVAE